MARWHYQQSREHYATLYGVSARTISRYAKDKYPLDDEAATRALIAGQRSDGGRPTAADGQRTAAGGRQADAIGLSASLMRLREAELAAYSDFQQAIADENLALATIRKKDWLDFSEQLRKAEKDSPEVAEANKQSVRIDEVQRALSELFTKLRQDLDSLPNRLAIELIAKDEIAIREVLKTETDTIVEALYHCKYLEGGANE